MKTMHELFDGSDAQTLPATTTDKETAYLAIDLFEGDESELTCRNKKMVTTRKDHPCSAFVIPEPHTIPTGERARLETARVDGSFWGRYYACTACLDRFIAGDFSEDDEDE